MVGKDNDEKIWLASAALAIVIITLALIISNMEYFQLGDREPPLGPITNDISEALMWVLLFVWGCVGILVLLQRGKRVPVKGRKDNPSSGSPYKALITLFIILGLILVFVYLTQGTFLPPATDPGTGDGGGGSTQAPVSASGPGDSMVLIGFLIFVVLMAVILSSKFVRKTPIRTTSAWNALEQQKAKDIVDQAMSALYAGDDARSVVVRTYQMMVRLLRGKVQDTEMLTPREIALLAERRLGWPKEPTMELTSLFEEAWYSDHRLKEESKEAALRCLTQISSSVGTNQGGQRSGNAAGS
ncbi:MAG TPA: DUF4129 domain-containing protein [Methanomassiliicoccales archaeon]|nr:DUF4129 domain-containing protein [Methanomassiliicoccales archaeon]